jgi:hypothetical protein
MLKRPSACQVRRAGGAVRSRDVCERITDEEAGPLAAPRPRHEQVRRWADGRVVIA